MKQKQGRHMVRIYVSTATHAPVLTL